MSAKFESVLDGMAKYFDNEIAPGMNDWQELLARIAMGRIFDNRENLKNALINNGIVRTLGIIDGEGYVDIEKLANDVKREITKKNSISISVPLFGNLKFDASDVDKLMTFIPGNNIAINAPMINGTNNPTVNSNTTNATNSNAVNTAPANNQVVNNPTNNVVNNNIKKEG